MAAENIVGQNILGYEVIKDIGSGSFGKIYYARWQGTGQEVAIKVENHSSKPQQLHFESKVYNILQHVPGVPRVYHYLTAYGYNIMILDILSLQFMSP